MDIAVTSDTTTSVLPLDHGSNPIIISMQTGLEGYRLRNFYITNSFQ